MTGSIIRLALAVNGGVPKREVSAADVTRLGLAGDAQAHPAIHGGPDAALCLFSLEVIERLRGEGHPIAPGSTGENLTIQGLDWAAIQLGDRLALGATVIIEITRLTTPCKQIAGSFVDRKFRRIAEHGDSRLYARVLREGRITLGDRVAILPAA